MREDKIKNSKSEEETNLKFEEAQTRAFTFMADAEKELDKTPEVDDINYWLDQPDDESLKPRQNLDCQSNCDKILKYFYTKKWVKISVLSGTFLGIDYERWMRLCELCKSSVMDWYFGEVFETGPQDRPSMDLFSLQIESDTTAIDWDMVCREYERMVESYHNENIEAISEEELRDMKRYCHAHERDYNDVNARLQTKMKELNNQITRASERDPKLLKLKVTQTERLAHNE